MSYSKIRDLNNSSENWTVQARLCRLWEAADFKNEKEVFALEMLFVDAQGDSIQGYVRKNHIPRFKSILKEDQIYNIGSFKIGTASPHYRVVPNSLRMYFNVTTSVRAVTNVPTEIPHHAFFFPPEHIVEERIGDNTLLTDIIGCVTTVGPIQIVATGPKKDIELQNNTLGVVKVTLWGNTTTMFDLGSYAPDEAPVIAIVTSTTVRKFKGKLSFRSTTATRTFFNIDLPEVDALAKTFAHGYEGIKDLQPDPSTQIPVAEQTTTNRVTIAQLLAMEWVSPNQEYYCTFVGEITEVDTRYGWCYVSCSQCTKKVVPKGGTFLCTPCNKPCLYPAIRYKLHVRVRDETGSTTLAIFNDEAEKHIKVAASTFMERVGRGDKALPDEIERLVGKIFIFKVKVTDYNLKDGFENYTVMKIFEEAVVVNKRKAGIGGSTSDGIKPSTVESMSGKEGTIPQPVTPEKSALESKKSKLQ